MSRLLILLVFALGGCGGGGGDSDTAGGPADAARKHAQAAGAAITQQPSSATVAAGAGVSFSIDASATVGSTITGYHWRRDGTVIFRDRQGSGHSSYSIPSVVAARHAGSYSVDVLTTNGTVKSAKATLSVLAGADWARLGGRVIASGSGSAQPSLTLCDSPTLAWIDTSVPGPAQLRVSRFDGTAWTALGAALNANPASGASEPSIDCLGASGTPRPVVAWSEALSAGGRAIRVKAWDGKTWLSALGNAVPIATNGADARKPVLRLAPANSHWFTAGPVTTHSALAWLEGGFARAKFWNGRGWQTYVTGWPAGSGLADLALTLDLTHPSNDSNAPDDYRPLTAHVTALSAGQTAVGVQAHVTGWAQLGTAVSPNSPAASPLAIAGIGFTNDGGGGGNGAVAVWAAGSAAYSIGSSRLSGSAYDTALTSPLGPQPAWAEFANPFSGTDLHAFSFDTRALETQCVADPSTRPTFALALNDTRGTRVLTARCNGRATDPLDWVAVQPAHARPATALSMKMETGTTPQPVFAAVEAVGGRFELSVWRFYP